MSSEQHWDFLQFYIDGNKKGEWSGIDNSWSFSYPVTVGVHEFEWEYDKDGWTEEGEDSCTDYIVFPPIDLGQLHLFLKIILVSNYFQIRLLAFSI